MHFMRKCLLHNFYEIKEDRRWHFLFYHTAMSNESKFHIFKKKFKFLLFHLKMEIKANISHFKYFLYEMLIFPDN